MRDEVLAASIHQSQWAALHRESSLLQPSANRRLYATCRFLHLQKVANWLTLHAKNDINPREQLEIEYYGIAWTNEQLLTRCNLIGVRIPLGAILEVATQASNDQNSWGGAVISTRISRIKQCD